MENKDQEWIENSLTDVNENTDAKFEAEVYFSTDGKNTVHVKSDTKEGRIAMLKWGNNVFARLKDLYGTKQAQAVKEYNKEEDLGVCKNCGAKNMRSMKGKVYCSAKCWLKE